MQHVVVTLIVLASAAYAAWALMPAAARAWVQRVLLRREGVVAASCCGGCSGCSTAPPKAPNATTALGAPADASRRPVIHIHRG